MFGARPRMPQLLTESTHSSAFPPGLPLAATGMGTGSMSGQAPQDQASRFDGWEKHSHGIGASEGLAGQSRPVSYDGALQSPWLSGQRHQEEADRTTSETVGGRPGVPVGSTWFDTASGRDLATLADAVGAKSVRSSTSRLCSPLLFLVLSLFRSLWGPGALCGRSTQGRRHAHSARRSLSSRRCPPRRTARHRPPQRMSSRCEGQCERECANA